MNSPTSIYDLPPEMICELYKHLPARDLVACSMVSKRWHSIYTGFRLYKLVVIDDLDNYPIKWRYSDQRKSDDQKVCDPSTFPRLAGKPLLSSLQHLALFVEDYEYKFDLNELNTFGQLLSLKVDMRCLGRAPVRLCLPKLKLLAFRQINYSCPLSVHCPQLSVLVYRNEPEYVDLLRVDRPGTIKKLDTDMFDTKLTPFKSVECLITQEFKVISKATLLSLAELNELHYNASIRTASEDSRRSFDQITQKLRKFIEDARVLRGSGFLFRFAGFQLTSTMLDDIDFGVRASAARLGSWCNSSLQWNSNEYLYLKNYQLIDPDATLEFINQFNYNFLGNRIKDIPIDFFRRFTGIEWVGAHGEVQNENHFLWFLKSLRSLRELYLYRSQLAQEFYDQLPASAHLLKKLSLNEQKPLNFVFITKLLRLSYLSINLKLSFESLASLLRWVGGLAEGSFSFEWNEKWLFIRKAKGSMVRKVSEYHFDRVVFETENPEEIIDFFEGLHSGSSGTV